MVNALCRNDLAWSIQHIRNMQLLFKCLMCMHIKATAHVVLQIIVFKNVFDANTMILIHK